MSSFPVLAFLVVLCYLVMTPVPSMAHFVLILPSDDIVAVSEPKAIEIEVSFLHPFEHALMDMAKPNSFGVIAGDKRSDLRPSLVVKKNNNNRTWNASYRIRRPGAHIVYAEPEPYWEPAEQKFIIQYTKVVVGALGLDMGWDSPAGLPVEIEPLARPYGLWTGNVFSGIVKHNGKPVPFAKVEVEYLNQGGKLKAPNDAFVTQVLKADAEGAFTCALPREGWWGIAALLDADYSLEHDGKVYPVELGGVIWVRARDMESK